MLLINTNVSGLKKLLILVPAMSQRHLEYLFIFQVDSFSPRKIFLFQLACFEVSLKNLNIHDTYSLAITRLLFQDKISIKTTPAWFCLVASLTTVKNHCTALFARLLNQLFQQGKHHNVLSFFFSLLSLYCYPS